MVLKWLTENFPAPQDGRCSGSQWGTVGLIHKHMYEPSVFKHFPSTHSDSSRHSSMSTVKTGREKHHNLEDFMAQRGTNAKCCKLIPGSFDLSSYNETFLQP